MGEVEVEVIRRVLAEVARDGMSDKSGGRTSIISFLSARPRCVSTSPPVACADRSLDAAKLGVMRVV